ncbi:18134_t:CDS:2 [Acaulospora morrowiae]|uniref:18134_t:CDS:1 n=1 Tax=Acaulospora morrowiae TaxID=94023 RepID=A0A9N9H060_9GLOM|nr:18134_t:CDS:2 [Acaulospora morrowiae]
MFNWNLHKLDVMGKTDITVNTRDRQQPPQRQVINATSNSYSIMVIEIGSTESLNSLHELVTGYFSSHTNIQIYLAIKLFSRYRDCTFALLVLFYRCDQLNPTVPCFVKSFETTNLHISITRFLLNILNFSANYLTSVGCGQVTCDSPNLPDYQLAIPTDLLFDNVPTGIPNDTPDDFFLDL